MRLDDLLKERETTIKQRWLDLIIATYAEDSRKYLKGQKNRFLNPIGAAVSRVIEGLYAHLLDGGSDADIGAILDEIVKIRAVQDFSPAQAVGFILDLKQAVREELEGEIQPRGLSDDLSDLETRLDGILLEAFNVYMRCREKIYELRATDLKRKSYLALRMMEANPAGTGGLK